MHSNRMRAKQGAPQAFDAWHAHDQERSNHAAEDLITARDKKILLPCDAFCQEQLRLEPSPMQRVLMRTKVL
eukprot:500092-Pelagomonas_calceolata.AAC.3